MTAELCLQCMSYHAPPACAHNPERPCTGCGRAVGYRFTTDDGKLAGDGPRCARCWWDPPAADPQDARVADLFAEPAA